MGSRDLHREKAGGAKSGAWRPEGSRAGAAPAQPQITVSHIVMEFRWFHRDVEEKSNIVQLVMSATQSANGWRRRRRAQKAPKAEWTYCSSEEPLIFQPGGLCKRGGREVFSLLLALVSSALRVLPFGSGLALLPDFLSRPDCSEAVQPCWTMIAARRNDSPGWQRAASFF